MSDTPLSAYLQKYAVPPLKPLTETEKRVADKIGRGWEYKEIGKQLRMSTRTVRHHADSAAAKLHNPDELHPKALIQIWTGACAMDQLIKSKAA